MNGLCDHRSLFLRGNEVVWIFGHIQIQTMHMTQEMSQQANEGLLHLVSKKALLRAF